MCSLPITSDVPVVDALGQCAICDEVFPFVNVLSCRRLKGGHVPICLTCHQRCHPACQVAQSVLCSNHYQCHVCGAKKGVIICALCSTHESTDEILEGVLMCEECSDHIHSTSKRHHSDHFYPVASPVVVSTKGPSHCHSCVDVLCEFSGSHNQPRPHVPLGPRAPSSASQHRESFPRGETSGLKPFASGGTAPQPQSVKQKVNGGSFKRFTRVV